MTRATATYPRIHVVGDSFTAGLYATTGNDYRSLLYDALVAVDADNASVVWFKGGVSGGLMQDAAASASDLQGFFRPEYHPDFIILALGQNDLTAGRTSGELETDTQTCLDYVQANCDAFVFVVAVPMQPSWRGGVSELLATAYNNVLRAEAEARGWAYLDGWARCLTAAGISGAGDVGAAEATAEDGYHPNNTGHQQLLDALWADLLPFIGQALRRVTASRSLASGRAAASGRATA